MSSRMSSYSSSSRSSSGVTMLSRHSTSVGGPAPASVSPATCSCTGAAPVIAGSKNTCSNIQFCTDVRMGCYLLHSLIFRHMYFILEVYTPSVEFFAPMLARCTMSFLSPSCIPLRPAIAWKYNKKIMKSPE